MNPHEEPLFSPEENNTLQEIGERSRHIIQQVTDAMHLGNVEVAITFDSRIDVKEFTIRGLLLPITPEMQEEARRKEEEKVRKLIDQLKRG